MTVAGLALSCGEQDSRPRYTEAEITFRNPSDGIQLAGTLTLPDGAGPFAAVVLVVGSGPHTRDLQIGRHRIFFTLADYLSHHGVATIRYDKRGTGQSGGKYEPYEIENFVDDALAGISFLTTHKAIDPRRIGAIGVSQGGLIVPIMATRSPAVGFIVLMAAPGVWGKEFFCLSSIAIARASGFGQRDIARIRELYDAMWPLLIKARLSISETAKATGLLRELATFMDAETRTFFHMDDIDSYFAFMRSPHVLESMDLNPADALKQVQCPLLAVTGSKDVQVSAKENLQAIENALSEGGNPSYKVVELNGLNHALQRCRTGLPGEYLSSREAIAPVALETITNWILSITSAERR
jgi:pimeloyl-ACP methyl ester carboxylesterase